VNAADGRRGVRASAPSVRLADGEFAEFLSEYGKWSKSLLLHLRITNTLLCQIVNGFVDPKRTVSSVKKSSTRQTLKTPRVSGVSSNYVL